MPPEYIALLDKPLLLFILLGLGAILGMAIERLIEGQKRAERRAYWKGRNQGKWPKGGKQLRREGLDRADSAADQLKIVSKAAFTSRALLNKGEASVFAALDRAVVARNPGWQVMAQVSLGEFLASPDKEAYGCVNSKRVDFALMDDKCRVVHALEYQGTGHHAGTSAAARDAVKKEALRKAGLGYHEVVAGHTTAGELRALVERLVRVGEDAN